LLDVEKISSDALLYIFLSEDYTENNRLSTLVLAEKHEEARKLVFGSKKLSDVFSNDEMTAIERGKNYYQDHEVSDYSKDMAAYDKKLDEVNDLIKRSKPIILKNIKESYGAVSYTSNLSIINGLLKDVVSIIITKTKLIEAYINGSSSKLTRGLKAGAVLNKNGAKI